MFDPYEYALAQGVTLVSDYKLSAGAEFPQIVTDRATDPITRRCAVAYETVRLEHPDLTEDEAWGLAATRLMPSTPREYAAIKRKHKKAAALATALQVTPHVILTYEAMHGGIRKENGS